MWIAIASIWISSAAAVGVALYFTHNINCLWFLLIPALISAESKGGNLK